jgi:hypothetical protein
MADVKKGDRIRLLEMGKDPCPVARGTKGTVSCDPLTFQGRDQIPVKWDDGRTLAMVSPPDRWERI